MEQISEELRTLDEMLAANEGADGAVEVTAEETSPAPSDDLGPSDNTGFLFFTQEAKYNQKYFSIMSINNRKLSTAFVFLS